MGTLKPLEQDLYFLTRPGEKLTWAANQMQIHKHAKQNAMMIQAFEQKIRTLQDTASFERKATDTEIDSLKNSIDTILAQIGQKIPVEQGRKKHRRKQVRPIDQIPEGTLKAMDEVRQSHCHAARNSRHTKDSSSPRRRQTHEKRSGDSRIGTIAEVKIAARKSRRNKDSRIDSSSPKKGRRPSIFNNPNLRRPSALKTFREVDSGDLS